MLAEVRVGKKIVRRRDTKRILDGKSHIDCYARLRACKTCGSMNHLKALDCAELTSLNKTALKHFNWLPKILNCRVL